MVSNPKRLFSFLIFRLTSIILLFLICVYIVSSNSGNGVVQLLIFIISAISLLLGFWFFSSFIPLPAFTPLNKRFTYISRTLQKMNVPTLNIHDPEMTSWKVGEKYSEVINPSRHFLIIKNNNDFIQIVRQEYFDLKPGDTILGILSAGRIIKSITINAVYPFTDVAGTIIKLDDRNPLNYNESSEQNGYNNVFWSIDFLITFKTISVLAQQENNSPFISTSQDEILITERFVTEKIRDIFENTLHDILNNQKRSSDKNNSLTEENLNSIIEQLKKKTRDVCLSGIVFNSLKFVISLDRVLLTNLRLTNSIASNSLSSENDGVLIKSLDVEAEKMALIHQHRKLIEKSFPNTSSKSKNQELI